jgi:hypothetical protein
MLQVRSPSRCSAHTSASCVATMCVCVCVCVCVCACSVHLASLAVVVQSDACTRVPQLRQLLLRPLSLLLRRGVWPDRSHTQRCSALDLLYTIHCDVVATLPRRDSGACVLVFLRLALLCCCVVTCVHCSRLPGTCRAWCCCLAVWRASAPLHGHRGVVAVTSATESKLEAAKRLHSTKGRLYSARQ